jgi:hypothetical protein
LDAALRISYFGERTHRQLHDEHRVQKTYSIVSFCCFVALRAQQEPGALRCVSFEYKEPSRSSGQLDIAPVKEDVAQFAKFIREEMSVDWSKVPARR